VHALAPHFEFRMLRLVNRRTGFRMHEVGNIIKSGWRLSLRRWRPLTRARGWREVR
jgi:hypothetical protein